MGYGKSGMTVVNYGSSDNINTASRWAHMRSFTITDSYLEEGNIKIIKKSGSGNTTMNMVR